MERLDHFMARANAAFYARENPYACFTTAPEISQVFGELCGLWAASVWQAMGEPDPINLAEAGPGRGTLMADALRAIGQAAPAFGRALKLHLVEMSPRLRELQAARLPGATWHERVEDVPAGPMVLLANEFLDALPIRQFARGSAGWVERHVLAGRFVDVPCAPLDVHAEMVERNEAAEAIVAMLARRVAGEGGAVLLIDYGPERPGTGDSLQALRDGKPADPLADPGRADLSAHVDFPRLAELARASGAAVHGPLAQGKFLTRLGLFQRADRLARGQEPSRAARLLDAAHRLAEPNRMGQLFKALCIAHRALPAPPGFADA